MKDLLRFTTIGSVDSGKSSLLGRLLYETSCFYDDQLEAIRKISLKKGTELDLSLLLDGLSDERSQGITIDCAYRYFETEKRKYIVADNPGHLQYTRNMFTGSSVSDLAVILIDAKLGILEQTKRHLLLASLLQIPRLCIVVNKIDLIDYSEKIFNDIIQDYKRVTEKLEIPSVEFIPICSLNGANVVQKSELTPWYNGPSFLSFIENVHINRNNKRDFRLPVQYVIRNGMYRGFVGETISGNISEGEEILVLPSQQKGTVKKISGFKNITLVLNEELDISRGDMIVRPMNQPTVSNKFDAWVCNFGIDDIKINDEFILKHTTHEVKARIKKIIYKINVDDYKREEASKISFNDICRVEIECNKKIFFDSYQENFLTGSFVLFHPETFQTVAGGLIKKNSESKDTKKIKGKVFWLCGLSGAGKSTLSQMVIKEFSNFYNLDGDELRNGLCSDLGFSEEDRRENIRRAGEVAKILTQHGINVIASFITPKEEYRDILKYILGDDYKEIYIHSDFETCERRDVKGLYKKARENVIKNFTGIGSGFEEPKSPDLIIETGKESVQESFNTLKDFIFRTLEEKN
jgi:bifunctional enzyme CysN/CysC